METLLNIAYGFIEGTDKVFTFLTTRINFETPIFHINLGSITPIELMSITGLMMLFTYYLIRGLTI